MKRLLALTLIFLLLTVGMPVFSYEFPSQFWELETRYQNALEAGDHQGVITYGKQIIQLMDSAPAGNERTNVLLVHCKAVGETYAKLGQYDESAKMFRQYQGYGNWETDFDGMKIAQAKELQYTSQMRIFTDDGQGVFYEAKNEQKNGVLYGACSDGEIRKSLDDESMVLTYQELGDSVSDWTKHIFGQAREKGLVVEFALNCPNQMKDIRNILSFNAYFKEISELFSEFKDVKVLLRFGAEFDLWADPKDGPEFVKAFQYVANFFKSRNENVAMVWSPNQVPSWNLNRKDFYPGDEYVDWVGISAYSNRYFQGKENAEEYLEVVFHSGLNADPVLAVQDIVKAYGDRKPILISESGFGHFYYPRKEDTSRWALNRMKEFYAYLPMIYPQIKGVAYFDKYIPGEPSNYTLQGELKETFLSLTQGARFVQQGNETSFAYRELQEGDAVNNVSGIYTYAHIYGETNQKVTYLIDGQWAGESTELPFGVYLDFSKFGEGEHVLQAIAHGDGGTILKQEWRIRSANWNSEEIDVVVGKESVSFDQKPILYADRTLVPLRAIFEKMGAQVTWDELTKTVTGIKGNRTVKLTMGSNVMRMNQKKVFLDVPAIQLNDRALVPVRAIAEGLGARVDWNGETATVVITPVVQVWSEWTQSLPGLVKANIDDYEIETKKQYRYRDTEYAVNTEKMSSSDGWLLDHQEVFYGDWSDWDVAPPTGGDYLIQTRSISVNQQGGTQTQYRYRDVEITYYYYRILDWSEYQDVPPKQEADREIEEITVVRYRKI